MTGTFRPPILPVHDPSPHLTRLAPVVGEIDAWRLAVPAKPACYLLEDAEHRPVLLATVGDLRQALVRRLSEPAAEEGSKRIDYRALVRYVRWRDVCSRFEGDWAYLGNARRLFAGQWRKMTRNWRAWWVGVDLDAAHPRFVSRDEPFGPAEHCFGPLTDGRLARRSIEALEDLFDLCREHHLLTQAPHAVACAYKQMGKCPAPCDGTITMEAYRQQLGQAIAFLGGGEAKAERAARITERIKQASGELNFELAARLKAQLDHVALFDHEARAHLGSVSRFRYIVLQRGRRKRHVRAFIVSQARMHFAGEMVKRQRAGQIEHLAELAERCFGEDVHAPLATAEIGLAAWHLLGPRRDGAFLPCPEGLVERPALAEAVARVADGGA